MTHIVQYSENMELKLEKGKKKTPHFYSKAQKWPNICNLV